MKRYCRKSVVKVLKSSLKYCGKLVVAGQDCVPFERGWIWIFSGASSWRRDRPSRCSGSSMSSTGRILSEQGFRNGGRRRKAASADGRRFGGSESCRKRSSSASMELGSLQRKTSIAASVLTGFKRIANEQRKFVRSEEHTSELQSRFDLVCRLLLEKKKKKNIKHKCNDTSIKLNTYNI